MAPAHLDCFYQQKNNAGLDIRDFLWDVTYEIENNVILPLDFVLFCSDMAAALQPEGFQPLH